MAKRDRDIETVIEGKVYQYLEEKDEKEKRECNIILNNIPESVSDEIEERKRYASGPLSLKGIKRCRSTSSENIFKIKMAWDTNCILLDAGGCLHKICN